MNLVKKLFLALAVYIFNTSSCLIGNPQLVCNKKNRPIGIQLNMPKDFYEKINLTLENTTLDASISQNDLIFFIKTYDFGDLDNFIPWYNIDPKLEELFKYLIICSQEHNLYVPLNIMPEKIVESFGIYFIRILIKLFSYFQKLEDIKQENFDQLNNYFDRLNMLMGNFMKNLELIHNSSKSSKKSSSY